MLKRILWIVILVYVGLCAVIFFNQDSMIFPATQAPLEELTANAKASGFEAWLNAAGKQIGWQSKEGDPGEALLIFNGNGGHALMRAYYREFTKRARGNWKVFLLEYPGYGARVGPPNEKALVDAGVEALDEVAVSGRRVWLLGESLGSGVASAVLAQRPDKVEGAILVTPFDSIAGAASFRFPWLPVRPLVRTRLNSIENLAHYKGPVAFVLCEKDTSVPAVLGQRLHDGFEGPKKIWIEPEADHDASGLFAEKWSEVVDWLQEPRS